MKKGDKVKIKQHYFRVVNEDMKRWVVLHKNDRFTIENIIDGSCKLYKIDFWITEDLLEKV